MEYLDLINSKRYTANVQGGGANLTGILLNFPLISSQADYSGLLDDIINRVNQMLNNMGAIGDAISSVTKAIGSVGAGVNTIVQAAAGGRKPVSVMGTYQAWGGTKDTLDLSMLILPQNNESYQKIIRDIAILTHTPDTIGDTSLAAVGNATEAIFGIIAGDANAFGTTTPPLDYNAFSSSKLSIRASSVFMSSGMFYTESASMKAIGTMTDDGYPQGVQIDLKFKPRRMLSAADINAMYLPVQMA